MGKQEHASPAKALAQFQKWIRVRDEYVTYGSTEVAAAAAAGAVDVLLIASHLTHDPKWEPLRRQIRANRGTVHVVGAKSPLSPELEKTCGLAACLRFPVADNCMDIDTTMDTENLQPNRSPDTSTSPLAPPVARTLSQLLPATGPACWDEEAAPAPHLQEERDAELELMHAMFAADRKLKVLSTSRIALLVDDPEEEGWVVLDVALPAQYPAERPLVAIAHSAFASSHGSHGCLLACTDALSEAEEGAPVLLLLYEAAREWLAAAPALSTD